MKKFAAIGLAPRGSWSLKRERRMKNRTFAGWLIVVSILVTFCFSEGTGLAAEVKLNKQAMIEVEGILERLEHNFSKSFDSNNLNNKELIRFGLLNANCASQKGNPDGSYMVTAKCVDDTVRRYFNLRVKHESMDRLKYRNGAYRVPAGAGEFGDSDEIVIRKMEKYDDSTVVVYANTKDLVSRKVAKKESVMLRWVSKGEEPHFIILNYRILK